jgi:hypothetical protein
MCSNCPIEPHLLGYYFTPFCSSIAFLCRYDTQNVTDALPCKLCRRVELGPHAFRILKNHGTQISTKQGSVEKESCFCILDHPCEAFLQIHAGNGTASDDVPLVRSNGIKLQPLHRSTISAFRLGDDITKRLKQTSCISDASMQPLTSVLFANTNRLAPESLCCLHGQ